jgi:hypothetical protein
MQSPDTQIGDPSQQALSRYLAFPDFAAKLFRALSKLEYAGRKMKA